MRQTKVKADESAVTLVSATEYLALEREAEERHEWLDGLVYQMASEGLAHNLIISNLIGECGNQLRGTPCLVFSPNMKTRAGWEEGKGLFAYPDNMIVCGKPVFHDAWQDVVINPKVIVEVQSETTANYDREEKFERYAANKTLTDYLLVSQKRPHIQHFIRKPRGRWEYVIETKLGGVIVIASIKCKLKLASVYDRIEFPPLNLAPPPVEEPATTKPRKKKTLKG